MAGAVSQQCLHVWLHHIGDAAYLGIPHQKWRIDVALIPRSSRLFYSLTEVPEAQLHVSPSPLYVFDRHVLMTASLPAATTQYIQQLVADLPHSARWQTLLRRYGLQQMNAPCPNF